MHRIFSQIRKLKADSCSSETREQRIRAFVRAGSVPWSAGYTDYRAKFVEKAIADLVLMQTFRKQEVLPVGYGLRLDERCVEYPWVLSRLPSSPGICLDAGSALNHEHILNYPAIASKKLHIVTLAPERSCFWRRGISYWYEDLRALPVKDNYYDLVVSISVLEHIGFDNSLFGSASVPGADRSEAFISAMLELWRVLKPGGHLLITLPFGKYQNFGTFQQFDADLLRRMEAAVAGKDIERGYYRYEEQGWQRSNEVDCQRCEYFPWQMLPKDSRSGRVPLAPDGAAAARAVACIRIVKPS